MRARRLCVLRTASRSAAAIVSSDSIALSAASKTAGMTEPVAIDPPEIGPGGQRGVAQHDFDLARAACRSSARRAARGRCRCRCRCPACRRRRAPCRRRAAPRWRRPGSAPRSTSSRPCPSRASARRASSSRLRACASTSRILRAELEAFDADGARRTECLSDFVDLRLVQQAKLDRVDLELDRPARSSPTRSRKGRARRRVRASRWASRRCAGAAEVDAQVRHAVDGTASPRRSSRGSRRESTCG